MACILKVEYQGELRRILANLSEEGKLSFSEVEGRIRDVFRLTSTSELKLTYQDRDGDIVTMANDHDLIDACVIQELNPLRLHVALLPAVTSSSATERKDVVSNVVQSVEETVEKLVGLYEPIFRKIFPENQMAERLLHQIVERVTKNINAPSYSTPPTGASRNIPTVSTNAEQKPEIHDHVTCDLCEMNPIVGPRYKSMRKINYDLCCSCYEKEGNANEYKRIQPLRCPGPASSTLVALRTMQIPFLQMQSPSPPNMLRAGLGMSPSFVCGPRGGRGRMGFARS